MTRTRRVAAAALLAVLALVLTGCMRMHVGLTLGEDDTVDGSMVFAVSDEVARSLGQEPQDVWDQMSPEITSDLPPGATQEPYAEDGFTGTRITFADQPLSGTGGLATGADDLSITREGDEYVVAGRMDLTDTGLDEGDASDPTTQQLLESVDVALAITFPGPVAESNGEVDGTTVTWRPVVGEVTEIAARGAAVADGAAPEESASPAVPGAEPGDDTADDAVPSVMGSSLGFPGWLPWVLLAIVVVGLGALGLVLWLVLRRRPAPAGTPVASAAYPGQPYPGQQAQPGQPYGAQPIQPYGAQPGQPHPGRPPVVQAGPYAPPADANANATQPVPPYAGAYPPPPAAPAAPAQPGGLGPNATQPLPPYPPAPQPSAPAPAPAPGDEIDDATHLRRPDEQPPAPPA